MTIYTMAKAPGGHPLVGHIGPLLRDPQRFVAGLPSLGDLVRIRIGPVKAIVVCRAELTDQVLRNDRLFDKGGPFYARVREVFGNGLITCQRVDHRRQRRIMQPAFHRSMLSRYANVMTDQTAAVMGTWRDGNVIDTYPAMQDITARTSAQTMFAAPAGLEERDKFCRSLAETVRVAFRRMLTPPLLDKIPTRNKRRYEKAIASLHGVAHQFMAEYRASGVDHGDLLSLLLAARDDEGQPLSDAELCDQTVSLAVAGTETTASTLSWAIYQVTRHPDVAERLREETTAALGDQVAGWQDLSSLPYTRQVILEALRLHPPAWLLSRVTTADTELGGHRIEAGTSLVYSPYLLHRRPDLFPDPEKFDPERWSGTVGPSLPRGAFVPFGEGARKCIGEQFAMTQAVITLASICARWELEPLPGARVDSIPGMGLAPRDLHVRLRSVSNVRLCP